jgi:hypothetical protein
MSFALTQRKHLEDEFTKIVRRELRNTVRALTGAETAFEDLIHESRKSVKKVRPWQRRWNKQARSCHAKTTSD